MTIATLDTFTAAYIEAALWSSCGDDGTPMDRDHSADDIHPDTLAIMIADCQDFQESFGEAFGGQEDRAGHDFWLTRNRHGAGFWDGDWAEECVDDDDRVMPQYPTIGHYLTEMSHPYGSFDLYIGDDGMIHGS